MAKIPTAVGEFIIVRHIRTEKEENKTKSGIIISREDRDRNGDVVFLARGEVQSWGSSEKIDLDIEKGDVVLYNPFDSQCYVIENEKYDAIHWSLVKGLL